MESNKYFACSIVVACAMFFVSFTYAYSSAEDRPTDVTEPLESIVELVQPEVPSEPSTPLESLTEPVESIVEGTETIPDGEVEGTEETTEEIVEEPTYESLTPGYTRGYYDIPLSRDLQDHIFALCDEAGIDPELVLAIIRKESNYEIDILGDKGRSKGLMQIQERWHTDRMEKLGVTDLLDPYQNVAVGIDLLKQLFGMNKSVEWVLMAYNGGPGYANKKFNAGIVTNYVTTVLEYKGELK